MLFNSFQFLIFVPIVFILNYAMPHKFRWVVLLVASYYFYMSWNPALIVLILSTTIVTYICARLMKKGKHTKLLLAISLIICLGLLFSFKYLNFFMSTLKVLLNAISIPMEDPFLDILLPVGISFYTFQTLSYVIDVYRKKVEPEKHFGIYALYVCFFPQLVAGPIERPQHLLPQFKKEQKFSYSNAAYGIKLMAWGFFKKIVIADTIARFVNAAYNNVAETSASIFIIMAVLFAVQIYCDFSGYSDIAIGCARVLGYDLMKNFNAPYLAENIQDFWKRWHISLSTWFMDYVYIPLGGNRVGVPRFYLNILITFVASGLWHGASWTFFFWGLLHGVYLIVYTVYKTFRKKQSKLKFLNIFITFSFVCFALIFFRADSLSDAWFIVRKIFTTNYLTVLEIRPVLGYINMNIKYFSFIAISLVLLFLYDGYSLKIDIINFISSKKLTIRWTVYLTITVIIVLMALIQVGNNSSRDFIYFQF
jgi:alginate O-acetyltransferase complex protein AlgI